MADTLRPHIGWGLLKCQGTIVIRNAIPAHAAQLCFYMIFQSCYAHKDGSLLQGHKKRAVSERRRINRRVTCGSGATCLSVTDMSEDGHSLSFLNSRADTAKFAEGNGSPDSAVSIRESSPSSTFSQFDSTRERTERLPTTHTASQCVAVVGNIFLSCTKRHGYVFGGDFLDDCEFGRTLKITNIVEKEFYCRTAPEGPQILMLLLSSTSG